MLNSRLDKTDFTKIQIISADFLEWTWMPSIIILSQTPQILKSLNIWYKNLQQLCEKNKWHSSRKHPIQSIAKTILEHIKWKTHLNFNAVFLCLILIKPLSWAEHFLKKYLILVFSNQTATTTLPKKTVILNISWLLMKSTYECYYCYWRIRHKTCSGWTILQKWPMQVFSWNFFCQNSISFHNKLYL